MAIIYLHGFASAGNSAKASLLRDYFPSETVVSPDLPVDPAEVEHFIDGLMRSLYARGEHRFMFVGTSMGGFYAWYFSSKYDCPALLVNPAINAPNRMAAAVGMHTNYATGEAFEWRHGYQSVLAKMKHFAVMNCRERNIEAVVALNDDVVPAVDTIEMFKRTHQYETGGHRFDAFGSLLPLIKSRYDQIVKNETLF